MTGSTYAFAIAFFISVYLPAAAATTVATARR